MEMTVSTHVNAPLDRVFSVFSDLERAAQHVDGIVAVEPLTKKPVDVGYRWRETRLLFRQEATEEMEISRFEPPHCYDVFCESHGTRYVTTFTFTPDEGGTLVTMKMVATPLTLLSKVMGVVSRFAVKSITQACAKDMEDLKEVAEATAVV